MSARIKYFSRCKGNILPAVCGDAKWRGVLLEPILVGNKWEVGEGEEMSQEWSGWGEDHAPMGSSIIPPCYFVMPAKKFNSEGCAGMREKVESKWLKDGSLA